MGIGTRVVRSLCAPLLFTACSRTPQESVPLPPPAAAIAPALPPEPNPESESEPEAELDFSQPLKLGANADDSRCRLRGATVPDGDWFGAVRAAAPDQLTFDVMCFFRGAEADLAAREDGVRELPSDGAGDYIRNRSKHVRSIPIDPDAQVQWLSGGGPDLTTLSYAQWLQVRSHDGPPVWLQVSAGKVKQIAERQSP